MKLVIEKVLYSPQSFDEYIYYVADCSYGQIEEREKIYKIDVISDGHIELGRYVNGEKQDVVTVTYDECAIYDLQSMDCGERYRYMLLRDDKAVVDYLNDDADESGAVYWINEPPRYMLVIETDTERFTVGAEKGFISALAGDKYKYRTDEISERIQITVFICGADSETLSLCEENNYQAVFDSGKCRISAFPDYISAQKFFAESEWNKDKSESTQTNEDIDWEW